MILNLEKYIGKVAVVTGASAGIGANIAKQLVEHGLIASLLYKLFEYSIKVLCIGSWFSQTSGSNQSFS